MVILICMAVSLLASILGSICGLGGGIVIKPVLDMTGTVGVAEASFLSSCTVLAMSLTSLFKSIRDGERLSPGLDLPLALGATAGGLIGKAIFQALCRFFGEEPAGAAQNLLLMMLTAVVLMYKIRENQITPRIIRSRFLTFGVGVGLGCISSLIGIGGGPINLLVISFFFGIQGKNAVLSSLFIIAFAQCSALVATGVTGGFRNFDLMRTAGMVVCGIAGGMIGSNIHQRISDRGNWIILVGLLLLIILICALNLFA